MAGPANRGHLMLPGLTFAQQLLWDLVVRGLELSFHNGLAAEGAAESNAVGRIPLDPIILEVRDYSIVTLADSFIVTAVAHDTITHIGLWTQGGLFIS